MSYGGSGAAGAAAAAIANAIKANGAIVQVEPAEFQKIVSKIDKPLIVVAPPGFLSKKTKYMTNYRGFFFYTQTETEPGFPSDAEFVHSKKIWIPS
jgi:hypothetical protein